MLQNSTRYLLASLVWLFVFVPGARAEDSQYWSQYSIGLWQGDRWTVDLYLEGRMTGDASRLSGVFTGPRVALKVHPNLQMSLAAKRIDLDGGGTLDGRLEFEVVPHFRISDRWKFDSRHRVESLHYEDRSDPIRFRHRFRFTRSLEAPDSKDAPSHGRWTRIFFANEFFHEDGERVDEWTENRLTPLGGRWSLPSGFSLDVSFLLRSRRVTDDTWRHDRVLVTFVTFRPRA